MGGKKKDKAATKASKDKAGAMVGKKEKTAVKAAKKASM